MLANHIDSYVSTVEPTYENGKLERILNTSEKFIGRLLHYYPVTQTEQQSDMAWCGWHNDHGSLTSLCPALYLNEQGKEVKVP